MKEQIINDLKRAIEVRLGWGPPEKWTNYDFEKLSEEIQKITNTSLSVSTLKRFFGKAKYGNTPSVTTLNTLAAFLDFPDWRDFEMSVTRNEVSGPDKPPKPTRSGARPFNFLAVGLGCIFIVLIGITFLNVRSRPTYNPADFSFSSKTMLTTGLPNSVIFDYDASKANPEDTIFIAQTWDIRRKFAVDKNADHYSSIYYYPGYFRAKLMAGNLVLQEHDIQITTDGWLGLVTAPWGERPLYFNTNEILRNEEVEVSAELLNKYQVSLFPELPEIRIFNQMDLSGFATDNFEFDTEVKSGFSEGKGACQRITIYLQAKDDILFLPLVAPACVGNLYVAAYGVGAGSDAADLSGFGCDLNDWAKVRVVCIDRHVQFFVNERLAWETEIANPVTEIVGVQYRFEGPGNVRNTKLTSGGKVSVFR
jgi:hypothetical protein